LVLSLLPIWPGLFYSMYYNGILSSVGDPDPPWKTDSFPYPVRYSCAILKKKPKVVDIFNTDEKKKI